MPNFVAGDNYLGIKRLNVPNWRFEERDPTPFDSQNVVVGDLWLNEITRIPWLLVSLAGNSTSRGMLAHWVTFSANASSVAALEGNTGGVVGPDMSGVINVVGDNVVVVTAGNITPNTLNIQLGGSVATSYVTVPATMTATPAAGVLTFAGTGGTTVSAAGSTITINGGGGSGAGGTVVTQFTASGTWTKNANAQTVEILIIGAGSGGGSGSKGASNTSPTASMGGGGGGGTGSIYMKMPAFFWGASASVTVAAGGIGGAGVAADSTNGNDGGSGGNASVGSLIKVYEVGPSSSTGGGGQQTGTSARNGQGAMVRYFEAQSNTQSNVAFQFGLTDPQAGVGRPSSVGAGNNSAVDGPYYMTAGSGGGGNGSFAGMTNDGGNGSNIRSCFDSNIIVQGGGGTVVIAAGVGGTGASVNGGPGLDYTTTNGYLSGGSGGGGGAGVTNVGDAPGNGGNGGYPGGGGGGGAGGMNTSVHPSGSGGNGGDAMIIIVEYLGTFTTV